MTRMDIIVSSITNNACISVPLITSYMTIGNLQKPLPRDVKLIIKESFFCGVVEGKPQVRCRAGQTDFLSIDNSFHNNRITKRKSQVRFLRRDCKT